MNFNFNQNKWMKRLVTVVVLSCAAIAISGNPLGSNNLTKKNRNDAQTSWQRFYDDEFGLEFWYPIKTDEGYAVKLSRDLYPEQGVERLIVAGIEGHFEIVKIHSTTIIEQYATSSQTEQRNHPGEVAITPLRREPIRGQEAFQFELISTVSDQKYTVVMVHNNDNVYRIVYNRQAQDLGAQITKTIILL